MQNRFDITNPPQLRAEPRMGQASPAGATIRAVPATSGGLVRATLGSGAAAAVILGLFWLPAEYGIDPTGLGRMMGLTQMGEIKQQLYAEADADDAAAAAEASAPQAAIAAADSPVLDRLTAIEAQLATIAAVVGAAPAPQAVVVQPQPAAAAATTTVAEPAEPNPAPLAWRDEVSYTLAPSEGVEVKLVMEEGAVAAFEWTANGGVVNYDTHGDGGGNDISYEQGRAVPEQAGELVATFTGNHGWFWRNRSDAPLTLTLRTRGDYTELRAP